MSRIFAIIFISLAPIVCTSCVRTDEPVRVENEESISGAVDLNSATVKELESLPGIGPETAQRIVGHRKKYGRFRRKQHLLLVEGISEEKYRKIERLITTH